MTQSVHKTLERQCTDPARGMIGKLLMAINDDDDDDDASPWLETSSWWQAGTERQLPLS